MKPIFATILAAGMLSACISSHLLKEIPPPGGCDQCHRAKIAGNWEMAFAPAAFGKEGGIPRPSDLALRGLLEIPYHQKVPAKRLAVFAATAPPETVGDSETGVECFACHQSPEAPHEPKLRGRHPWDRGTP